MGKGDSHNGDYLSKVPLCLCHYSREAPHPTSSQNQLHVFEEGHQIKILSDQQLITTILANSLKGSKGILCSNTLFINCSNNQFQGDYCHYKL